MKFDDLPLELKDCCPIHCDDAPLSFTKPVDAMFWSLFLSYLS